MVNGRNSSISSMSDIDTGYPAEPLRNLAYKLTIPFFNLGNDITFI